MKQLFTRITKETLPTLWTVRDKINTGFFMLNLMITWLMWITFTPPNTPMPAFIFGLVICPLTIVGLHWRQSTFIFSQLWLFIAYNIFTNFIFYYYLHYFSSFEYHMIRTEFAFLLLGNFGGYILAAIISLPFKLINEAVYHPSKFYYTIDEYEYFDKKIFPERYPKKEDKTTTKSTTLSIDFGMMNETQLDAELRSAMNDERYEDAKIIKELLEKKFGR